MSFCLMVLCIVKYLVLNNESTMKNTIADLSFENDTIRLKMDDIHRILGPIGLSSVFVDDVKHDSIPTQTRDKRAHVISGEKLSLTKKNLKPVYYCIISSLCFK